MRLLPRSLFGRLTLILVAGLVVAQLLSLGLTLRERSRLLHRFDSQRWAQHMADTVRLVEALPPGERGRVTRVVSRPHLRVVLRQQRYPRSRGQPLSREMSGLSQALHDALGSRLASVMRVPADAPGLPPGRRHRDPDQRLFLTQVRLRDGQWLMFLFRPPPLLPGHPMRLLVSSGALLIALLVLGIVAVRWVTRPLRVLADAAEALGRDIDRAPLPETGPAEMRHAVHAFNQMQQRLRESLELRNRFLAAVSHELKTPLTRLRLRVEMLTDEAARSRFGRDLDDMESMITASLDFVRGAYSQEPARPIDVLALVESVVEDESSVGHRVDVSGTPAARYSGRPQALRRCLENLVSNAIKYGGAAHIRIEDDPGALVLRVRDEGPGMPPSELDRVFEPFYRLEASRSRDWGGTGLGLGIARNIAEIHGGMLELHNRPGGGLEAVLTLPRPVTGQPLPSPPAL
ncbi:MAG TPA: ATP-binding protein [Gammaproteobacteria bacterium]|nr:ATP-binding protein [Gammaproteobacteria bacterium]